MSESYEKIDYLPPDSTSEQFAERLKTQMLHCSGFDGDEISNERKQAADYYFQRPRGDEVDGSSHYVSGDVAAMVDATLAQMAESFSSDRICDFDPMGPEDEDQAQLESEAVQYYVMGRENGFINLMTAIKEALMFRNGVIDINADDITTNETRRLGNVDEDALSYFIEGDDVVSYDYDRESGDLSVTRRVTKREFVMRSVSMENFIYHSEWHQPTLPGIPLCATRHIETRSSLIDRGFPRQKVDNLTQYRHPLKPETQARNPRSKKYTTTAIDKSQQLVEFYRVYVNVATKDGSSELRCVYMHYVDAVILQNKPASRIQLAAGTCIINPHRFTGISQYDKLKQNQDNRTALRRALHDNVNAVNRTRLAGFDNIVNKSDVASARVNQMVRVKNLVPDVRQALMPIMVQDTSANILANLESSARERSEMGGAALDLQTSQVQIGGDRMGSQGLDRAYSVSEQLSANMMKTIASTLIRDVFLVAHATLKEYFDEPLPIKRKGKWAYVNPSEWPDRKNVTIKPGMSPGERARRADTMAEIINSHMMLLDRQMEGVMVDLPGFNRALMDWARLKEAQNPEQYYVDPESPEAQNELRLKGERSAQNDKEKKALMQAAYNVNLMTIALQKYEGDADRIVDVFKSILSSEVEEAKIVGAATADLVKLQRAGPNAINGTGTPGSGEELAEQPAATEGT